LSSQIWGENPYDVTKIGGWISRNVGVFVFLMFLIVALITGGVVGFYCYRKKYGHLRGKSFTSNAHKGTAYKLETGINARDNSID